MLLGCVLLGTEKRIWQRGPLSTQHVADRLRALATSRLAYYCQEAWYRCFASDCWIRHASWIPPSGVSKLAAGFELRVTFADVERSLIKDVFSGVVAYLQCQARVNFGLPECFVAPISLELFQLVAIFNDSFCIFFANCHRYNKMSSYGGIWAANISWEGANNACKVTLSRWSRQANQPNEILGGVVCVRHCQTSSLQCFSLINRIGKILAFYHLSGELKKNNLTQNKKEIVFFPKSLDLILLLHQCNQCYCWYCYRY